MADPSVELITVLSSTHRGELINGLWRLFINRQGLDVIFLWAGRQVRAHRIVADVFLSANRLEGAAINAAQDRPEHTPNGDTPIDSLLEFLYLGRAVVNPQHLYELLRMADTLGFVSLTTAVMTASEHLFDAAQPVVLSSTDHHDTLVNGFWSLLRTGRGTDVHIRWGDQSTRAHRLLVDVFLTPDRATGDEFHLPGDCATGTLDSLLAFMYGGEVDVSPEQLECLWAVSANLRFEMLSEAIEEPRSRLLAGRLLDKLVSDTVDGMTDRESTNETVVCVPVIDRGKDNGMSNGNSTENESKGDSTGTVSDVDGLVVDDRDSAIDTAVEELIDLVTGRLDSVIEPADSVPIVGETKCDLMKEIVSDEGLNDAVELAVVGDLMDLLTGRVDSVIETAEPIVSKAKWDSMTEIVSDEGLVDDSDETAVDTAVADMIDLVAGRNNDTSIIENGGLIIIESATKCNSTRIRISDKGSVDNDEKSAVHAVVAYLIDMVAGGKTVGVACDDSTIEPAIGRPVARDRSRGVASQDGASDNWLTQSETDGEIDLSLNDLSYELEPDGEEAPSGVYWNVPTVVFDLTDDGSAALLGTGKSEHPADTNSAIRGNVLEGAINGRLRGGRARIADSTPGPKSVKKTVKVPPQTSTPIDSGEVVKKTEKTRGTGQKVVKKTLIFRCQHCDYETATLKGLTVHQATHQRNFQCSQCRLKFGDEAKLAEHRRSRHANGDDRADRNDRRAQQRAALVKDNQKKNVNSGKAKPTPSYPCSRCASEFRNETILAEHHRRNHCGTARASNTSDRAKRKPCPRSCRSAPVNRTENVDVSNQRSNRRTIKREPSDDESETDQKCVEKLDTERKLKQPKSAANSKQPRQHVSSSNSDAALLIQQRKSKQQNAVRSSLKCSECSGIFQSEQQLVRHTRAKHPRSVPIAKEQPPPPVTFRCMECTASFRYAVSLARHARSMHSDLGLTNRTSGRHKLSTDEFDPPEGQQRSVHRCQLCDHHSESKKMLRDHLVGHLPVVRLVRCDQPKVASVKKITVKKEPESGSEAEEQVDNIDVEASFSFQNPDAISQSVSGSATAHKKRLLKSWFNFGRRANKNVHSHRQRLPEKGLEVLVGSPSKIRNRDSVLRNSKRPHPAGKMQLVLNRLDCTKLDRQSRGESAPKCAKLDSDASNAVKIVPNRRSHRSCSSKGDATSLNVTIPKTNHVISNLSNLERGADAFSPAVTKIRPGPLSKLRERKSSTGSNLRHSERVLVEPKIVAPDDYKIEETIPISKLRKSRRSGRGPESEAPQQVIRVRNESTDQKQSTAPPSNILKRNYVTRKANNDRRESSEDVNQTISRDKSTVSKGFLTDAPPKTSPRICVVRSVNSRVVLDNSLPDVPSCSVRRRSSKDENAAKANHHLERIADPSGNSVPGPVHKQTRTRSSRLDISHQNDSIILGPCVDNTTRSRHSSSKKVSSRNGVVAQQCTSKRLHDSGIDQAEMDHNLEGVTNANSAGILISNSACKQTQDRSSRLANSYQIESNLSSPPTYNTKRSKRFKSNNSANQNGGAKVVVKRRPSRLSVSAVDQSEEKASSGCGQQHVIAGDAPLPNVTPTSNVIRYLCQMCDYGVESESVYLHHWSQHLPVVRLDRCPKATTNIKKKPHHSPRHRCTVVAERKSVDQLPTMPTNRTQLKRHAKSRATVLNGQCMRLESITDPEFAPSRGNARPERRKRRSTVEPGTVPRIRFFRCILCDRAFLNRELRDSHVCRGRLPPKVIRCTDCDYSTPHRRDLNLHRAAHDPNIRVFVCPLCAQPFSSLDRHTCAVKSPSVKLRCPHCAYRTAAARRFQLHLAVHDPSVPVFRCRNCAKPYPDEASLALHKCRRKKLRQCERCSYKAFRRSEMERHVEVEHANKGARFGCAQCGEGFVSVGALTEHQCPRVVEAMGQSGGNVGTALEV